MTAQLAKGPNGEVMLSLADATKEHELVAQSDAVIINLKHDAADRDGEEREKIKNDEKTVDQVPLDKKGVTAKTITTAWAIPRQVPSGPHSGRWYIPVPADDKLMNERDPKTGVEKGKDHPAWKNAETEERNPADFPSGDL